MSPLLNCLITLFCFLFGSLSVFSVQAVENIRFQGTLIAPPPCVINGGEQIEVNFGERIGVNKVDGVNYLQTVDYRLQCDPGTSSSGLGLTLHAPASMLGPEVVWTNTTGFGIRMTLDGQPFIIGKRVQIDAEHLPVLQAVPVKAPGKQLEIGAFDVMATLLADYQ